MTRLISRLTFVRYHGAGDVLTFEGPPDEPRNEKGEWTSEGAEKSDSSKSESPNTTSLKSLLYQAKKVREKLRRRLREGGSTPFSIFDAEAVKKQTKYITMLCGMIRESKKSGSNSKSFSLSDTGLNEAMLDWKNSLTSDEHNAVTSWLAASQGIRNAQKGVDSYNVLEAQNFHAAMQKAPMYKGAVYRGQSNQSADDIAKLKVGATVIMPADTSSSTSSGVAKSFTSSWGFPTNQSNILEINSKTARCLNPQGSYNLGLGMHEEEKEVVLQMGTKYRIAKFEPNYYGPYQNKVTLEEE